MLKEDSRSDGIAAITITPFILTPHVLDQPMITPCQTAFSLSTIVRLKLSRIHFGVCFHNVATLKEISSKWRCIAKCLECSIHIAGVCNVLKSNQAAFEVVSIVGFVVATIVTSFIDRRHLIVAGIITTNRCTSFVRLAVGRYKNLRFTNVAPTATGGQV